MANIVDILEIPGPSRVRFSSGLSWTGQDLDAEWDEESIRLPQCQGAVVDR